MEVGEQATETELTEGTTATTTVAELDLVESSVDVAAMVAVPAADGVNSPEEETVPLLAVQFTVEL
jgi:hypothetical protein